jgi:hypothetical protein
MQNDQAIDYTDSYGKLFDLFFKQTLTFQ